MKGKISIFLIALLLLGTCPAQSGNLRIDESSPIVGKWVAKLTELMMAKMTRVDSGRDEVEFFKNGTYIWIEDGASGMSTSRGTYVYIGNALIVYDGYDKKAVNGHYHFRGQVSMLSKKTMELVSSDGMMKILYERKW